MTETVTLTINLPKPLHDELMQYAASLPERSIASRYGDAQRQTIDDILTLSISLYLLQNGTTQGGSRSYRLAARYYLDTFFRGCAA